MVENMDENLLVEETELRYDNAFKQYPGVVRHVMLNKIKAIFSGRREGLHTGVKFHSFYGTALNSAL